jgi:cell division protease FtsH
MGMFLAGILLAAILGVAALSKDAMQNRGVERNYYKVRALLLDDRLDPETLELAHDTRTLRANVKDPGEGPTEVALEFATDDEMTRFRQDVLDRYNSEHPGANLDWKVTQYNSAFWSALLATLPWLALIVLAYFFLVRQVRAPGAGGGVLGFGRTRARATRSPSTGVTFADVAGISSAKAEVLEVIEFLRDPRRFQKLGGRMPRGIISSGRPGRAKRCSQKRSRARQKSLSTASAARISSRCSSAWARPACATYSVRLARTPRASFSWTKSTP